ncbi:hypothetical protein Gp_68 [Bacillus phage vB_Bacillus_1020A]|uniref:hypothetical protein n=1 Tax=Robertmurraya sp. DFI.2.37 TaxID=3031819 RepID=UPI001244B4E7|nr:hypothetical protein [Robertmurraya sp. DFI.2.37]MDF1511071.1 hypothetical protein [Robertmurraya sp. DFI.2.37]QIW89342.1 hypothetical protein Gp_68 [Bacillus phage vB_Bacillus_1020A]
MDLKTLEYMEERASKARKLVNRIDDLTKSAEKILGSECVKFISMNTGVSFYGYELVTDIQKHALEAINREISRLEKELAEL